MTRYDALALMETALTRLAANGVDVRDVRHLAMYRDYERLTREGHKNMYIVHYLSEQYGIDIATIYRVVKRMRTELH